ncbi:MAG TPA: hypothetical protein VK945_10420 [Planococcus sp. (in: firmicutes)]|nr:hypothetical protein [Planococcus sp. (in: firmicutes)]
MKTGAKIIYFSMTLLLLAGCGNHEDHEDATDEMENTETAEMGTRI